MIPDESPAVTSSFHTLFMILAL